MKRITAWAAVLTLTLSLLTGCAQIDESSADELPFPSEETPVEEEHSGLPAVFALPYLEGQPLNPLSCPDGVQQTVASLLYEGLFRLDQAFTPQPLLCASYTYDSETLTYKLTLRDGVVFSDGSPLTAADVKATLNAARSSVRYARRLSDVKSISAGDGTVTLTLNRPNTGLPALLDIPILKSGTEKHSVPLGTGPYLYDESSESCLIASQNWWRHISQPVERISLTGTADQESMLYRFSSRDVQLIVADGLSSTAINANIENVLPVLMDGLSAAGLRVGTPFFVRYGRVAVEDEIAELVGAKVVCIFVGERPGLGTAESMSAYLAYNAKIGMPEARRTVVSNIHKDGITAVEAGAYLTDLIQKILDKKASGVELQN